MFGVLGLGFSIACISCLCCLCTSCLTYITHLIDIRRGKCPKEIKKDEDRKHLVKQKELQTGCSVGYCGIQSGECPCNIKYVLDPVLVKRTVFPSESCNHTKRRKLCICPSLLELLESDSNNV